MLLHRVKSTLVWEEFKQHTCEFQYYDKIDKILNIVSYIKNSVHLQPGIHLSVSINWAVLSQLGVLEWTAFQAWETGSARRSTWSTSYRSIIVNLHPATARLCSVWAVILSSWQAALKHCWHKILCKVLPWHFRTLHQWCKIFPRIFTHFGRPIAENSDLVLLNRVRADE